MSWKTQRLLNIVIVIIAWLSLPILGKRNVKRFLPASILIVLIEGISAYFGKRRKWWVFYNKPNSYTTGELPFLIGPFLVGSMWILKWTYGNLKRFLLLNAVIDAIFAFPCTRLLRKIKLATLVRLNEFQYFLHIFYKAFLLYGFQYLFENRKKIIDSNRIDKEKSVHGTVVQTNEEEPEYFTKSY